MADTDGTFVWFELMTTDMDAAAAFYEHVVGWSSADSGMPGMRYTIVQAGATGVGGIMTLPPEAQAAGGQPGWIGYVGVSDVDAKARQVAAEGGAVHKPAADIPGVGRFAVVADPQGAAFTLFQEAGGGGAMPRPAPGSLGANWWAELHGAAPEPPFGFYASLFGWQKTTAMDMGPDGKYQMFTAGAAVGGMDIGGMMVDGQAARGPLWLFYFGVDGIDAAAARVREKGGTVLAEPMEVPGGMWIINGRDPQGATFALVAAAR